MKEIYVPDELAVTTRLLERLVEEGKISGKIVVHKALLRQIEYRLSTGDDSGINALSSLRKICSDKDVELDFVDGEEGGTLREKLRELAAKLNGTLVTSDPMNARTSEALGIKVFYVAPKGFIHLDEIFKDDIMSLHLKEGVRPRVKRGLPGRWTFEELSEEPLTREKIELIIAEIMESVYALYGSEAFIEVDKPGTTIFQLKDYRVVISRPPFSDGLEVTVVKPIARKSISDYSLPRVLLNRLEERSEGILIAGPPGMGKSTLAQALAEYYRSLNKVVKTIESPRDLQLPPDVTQYSKSNAREGEIYDVLLLSRPDYTIFDEMRSPEDFDLFIDLRLAGVGMVGVIHATSPIDAIQRIANRTEIGVLPSVVDTVIFMHSGQVSKIYVLELTVKVPKGLRKADLARPTVTVKNLMTGRAEYELYVFGERTFFVPIESEQERSEYSRLIEYVSHLLSRHIPEFDVRMQGETLRLYIPPAYIKAYVKKCQAKVMKVSRNAGADVEVVPYRTGESEYT